MVIAYICRRYSAFEALYKAIINAIQSTGVKIKVPSLPAKQLIKRAPSEAFLDKRQQGLHDWLCSTLQLAAAGQDVLYKYLDAFFREDTKDIMEVGDYELLQP